MPGLLLACIRKRVLLVFVNFSVTVFLWFLQEQSKISRAFSKDRPRFFGVV